MTRNAFDYEFLLEDSETAENVTFNQHANTESSMIERHFIRKRAVPGKLLKPADIMKQGRDFGKAQVVL